MSGFSQLTLERRLHNFETYSMKKPLHLDLKVQTAEDASELYMRSECKFGDMAVKRKTLKLTITLEDGSTFFFSGATSQLVDEGNQRVLGTRKFVVSEPWKKMSCVWTLQIESDGPKVLTCANLAGRTLLFLGNVDASDAAAHADALVASLQHDTNDNFSGVSKRKLSVDLGRLSHLSKAERGLVLAIAVDPWWTETMPADRPSIRP